MPENTPILGLFKYLPDTDGNLKFNIVNALNNNWDKIDFAINNKLNTSEYTAADVLAKLLTVDVSNSGLNCSTLQGLGADVFSRSTSSATLATNADTDLRDTFLVGTSATGSPDPTKFWHVKQNYFVTRTGTSSRSQKAIENNPTSNQSPRVFYRIYNDSNGGWTPWTEVFTDTNYGTPGAINANTVADLGDRNRIIRCINTGSIAFTIPGNVFKGGDTIGLIRYNGSVLYVAGSQMTLRFTDSGKRSIKGQYQMAMVYFVGPNEAVVTGVFE